MSLRPRELNIAKLPLLFRKEFELCAVSKGETMILLTDLKTRPEFVPAAFAAAEELGAAVYEMRLPESFTTTHLAAGDYSLVAKGAFDAIAAADIAVFFGLSIGSDMMDKARAAGTRFLLIYDHPDDLGRLMSPPGLKEAALHARDRIQKSSEMRLISKAGTDMRASIGDMTATCQYGFSESPGRQDHWGAGHCTIWPNVGTASGTVVLKAGDAWALPYCRMIEDDVRLTIRQGVIVEIEGRADAFLMRQYCDAHKRDVSDDGPYHVGHLGWGLNPNAIRDQIAVHGPDIERIAGTGRAWAGSFTFSTGPNDKVFGKRKPKPH